MGQGPYIGDDGRSCGTDPCSSSNGRQKRRWPNEDAAWFVCDLAARGLYDLARTRGWKLKLYPYQCPKCDGWHTATAQGARKLKRHEDGLRAWRARSEKDRK